MVLIASVPDLCILFTFKELGLYLKTRISAATHPRTINLVSIQILDIALLSDGLICKVSNFHINDY